MVVYMLNCLFSNCTLQKTHLKMEVEQLRRERWCVEKDKLRGTLETKLEVDF